jgi:preprotein translocase subunit SecE
VAKSVSSRNGKSDNGKPANKKARGGNAPAKRSAAKPARGKAQPRSRAQGKGGKPAEKRGFMRFLRDVRIEMGKVTWPTRKDLVQSTIVVLVAVAIATAYTGVLDVVFKRAVDLVIQVLT